MAADSSTTHFELFGLPPSFEVDLARLDSGYRELQRTLHPDRFVTASDLERRLSMQQATRVNEGYQTLRDPLKRGRYLLELSGYRFDDQHHTTSDAAFLMEQMELREKLESMHDLVDPDTVLDHLMDERAGDIKMHQAEFKAAYDQNDMPAAASACVKMQYLEKLQLEAEQIEADLMDS